MTNVKTAIIDDTHGFAQLAPEWNQLLAASASDSAFLTHEWLFTWWRHFHSGRRLCLITVRAGEKLIALAPFVQCRGRRSPLRVVPALEFLGSDAVGSEYLDIIVRQGWESAAVSAISKVLTDRRTMLDLVSVREGPSGVRLLQTGMDQQGWTPSGGPLGPCRFIPLAGTTWDTYLAGLGSHHRSNVRRRLREIGKAFDLRFETVTTEGERSVALSNLIKLHDERWRPRGGSMAFRTGAQCAFHEDITRVFLERGWLRLFSLRLNGDVVAALYGFTYGRKFYFYQSGFNPEYGKYSVGLVTMALSIQTAIKEELAEFDMLYGVEQYKSLWATASRQLVRVECGPPGLGQLLHQASVGVRRLRRALLRAWTPARVGGTVASVWSSVDLMVLGSGF